MSDVTAYFTGLADEYDRHRPGYPPEAFAAMLDGLKRPVRAIDVGCGTGISTRLLAASGAKVVGLDPNADMIAKARGRAPAIDFRQAAAESTGLADRSVDLVLCAQSFHWFGEVALPEFHRILVPVGRLALMWNVRDESDGASAAYEAVVRRAQEDARREGRRVELDRAAQLDDGGLFSSVRLLTFHNPHRLDLDGLVGRARSASYFPKSGAIRDELEEELQRLWRRWAVNGVVTIRQRTELTLAERAR